MAKSSSLEQQIRIDYSGLEAAATYLRNRNDVNLRALASSPGGDFAYRHYIWSNMDHVTTAEDFWAARLVKVVDVERTLNQAIDVKDRLLDEPRERWLTGVLEYLPEDHKFDTVVYLTLGYDNIAYGRNVALNLSFTQFKTDYREAVYYLMHELAHAGYLSYHQMPDLATPRTIEELAANVRFLTHLEGMGVITPLRVRSEKGGLGDPDYIALGDTVERRRRVHTYLEKYKELEDGHRRSVSEGDLSIYDVFSRRPSRLWYVAGCHMAQTIETVWGRDVLRELVRGGCDEFFKSYRVAPDPLLV